MPFTFSHPAIVLPIKPLSPKWVSMTGLIIGSTTPDFEYFIRMSDISRYSHTISGIFWYDLPLGILLCFIFHNIVASALIRNLPQAWGARLSHIKNDHWNQYFRDHFLVVCISIIIGAASHIFWDGFTHRGGYFVHWFPILMNKVYLSGYSIQIFKLLQHAGTILGGLVLILFAWKLPPDNNLKTAMTLKYWGSVLGISILVVAIRLLTGLKLSPSFDLVMTIISAGLIAVIVTPLLLIKKIGQTGFEC